MAVLLTAPLSYEVVIHRRTFLANHQEGTRLGEYARISKGRAACTDERGAQHVLGRGERPRASDACEKRMRLLAWTERISHAEAMLSAAVNSSSLSLRLYIRYGSSISISIDLSLIHGILVVTVAVADGENSQFH